jgi:two-component system LytT family sensor kinase
VIKHISDIIIKYKIHFLGWTLFISCEIGIVGLATGVFGYAESYFWHYLLKICYFYLCALWLYPITFSDKFSWIWKVPLLGSLAYGLYLITSYLIDNFLLKETSWFNYHEITLGRQYIFSALYRALFFMGFAAFYFLFLKYDKEVKARKQSEKEHYQSQLYERDLELQLENAKNAYLKAQINPHLLFNTLSFIYQDIYQNSPKSADTLMELADIMRYSINSDFKEQTIPLKEEIEQVHRLIGLHQSRYDNMIYINFEYDPNIPHTRFIPLVVVTIAENIFKHGIFQDKQNPALLSIKTEGQNIRIISKNLPSRTSAVKSLNKGIENISQRLKIIYGDNASLTYGIVEKYFQIQILAPIKHKSKVFKDS